VVVDVCQPSITTRGNSWRDQLHLHRVSDLIDHFDGTPDTVDRVRAYIEEHVEMEGDGIVSFTGDDLMGFKQLDYIPITRYLSDFRRFLSDADLALEWAVDRSHPEVDRYSIAAQNMMRMMGWKPGKGAGKKEDGISSPIPPTTPPPWRQGGAGLLSGWWAERGREEGQGAPAPSL